jgi:hypothetical protein
MDDSEKQINSLNNFEFEPAWENVREVNNSRQNIKKTKESRKHTSKFSHKQKPDDYKITPYVKQNIIDAVKSKLKKDGITRSINSISKEIENKNLYEVTIQSLNKKRNFFKLKGEDAYSYDEDQIVNELLYHKNLVKIDIVEKVKFGKELKSVLLCNRTNAVFPPTSHNLFHNAIDYHLIKNKVGGNREKYIESLSISSESENINKLHSDGINVCAFYLPNNKKFTSISAITKEIKENQNQQFFKESKTIKIGVREIFENHLFKHIQSLIKSNEKKIRRTIELNVLRILKKSKYHIISVNKQSFVCGYHPGGNSIKELNSQTKKIIDIIDIHKKNSIKSIMSDCEKLNISKLNLMKEIKWLIQIGIVRLYESGKIELIKYDKS